MQSILAQCPPGQDPHAFIARHYDNTTNLLGEYPAKHLITSLTMMAEDRRFAPTIASFLERKIYIANPARKLPLFYLMDSILKNVGEPYIGLIGKNIIRLVTNISMKVGAQDLRRIIHTINTWKRSKMFPDQVLDIMMSRALDAQSTKPVIDPSHPVSYSNIPPPSYVNMPMAIPSSVPMPKSATAVSAPAPAPASGSAPTTAPTFTPTTAPAPIKIPVPAPQRITSPASHLKHKSQPMAKSNQPYVGQQNQVMPSATLYGTNQLQQQQHRQPALLPTPSRNQSTNSGTALLPTPGSLQSLEQTKNTVPSRNPPMVAGPVNPMQHSYNRSAPLLPDPVGPIRLHPVEERTIMNNNILYNNQYNASKQQRAHELLSRLKHPPIQGPISGYYRQPNVPIMNTMHNVGSNVNSNTNLYNHQNSYQTIHKRNTLNANVVPPIPNSVYPSYTGNPSLNSAPTGISLQNTVHSTAVSSIAKPLLSSNTKELKDTISESDKNYTDKFIISKERIEDNIQQLYAKLPYISVQDGIRFSEKKHLNDHLDLLFQKNRAKKENKVRSRAWYPSKEEWASDFHFGILNSKKNDKNPVNGNTTTSSSLFELEIQKKKEQEKKDEEIKILENQHVVLANEKFDICRICNDLFDKCWNDDEEEWMYRNSCYGYVYDEESLKINKNKIYIPEELIKNYNKDKYDKNKPYLDKECKKTQRIFHYGCHQAVINSNKYNKVFTYHLAPYIHKNKYHLDDSDSESDDEHININHTIYQNNIKQENTNLNNNNNNNNNNNSKEEKEIFLNISKKKRILDDIILNQEEINTNNNNKKIKIH